MRIKDLKIGTKLYISFITVVLIFSAVAVYQIFGMMHLSELQDEGAGRASDALEVTNIDMAIDESYAVMADGIINRNVAETKENWREVRATAEKNIARVKELVDTAEERALAEEFGKNLNAYLGLFENKLLPIIEKEESLEKRVKDALAIMAIELRVEGVYPVAADAIINRNLDETRDDLDAIRDSAQKDIATVREKADTEDEKNKADDFASAYNEYLDTIEDELLPLLVKNATTKEIRKIDGMLDTLRDDTIEPLESISHSLKVEMDEILADEATIREVDGELDGARVAAMAPLGKIVDAINEENIEADEEFDSTATSSIQISTVFSVIGGILALLAAFLITRAIQKPLFQAVDTANKLADGDLTVDIEVTGKDETGQLLAAMKNMVGKLKNVVMDVKSASDNVVSGSQQMSATSEQMSQGATEQAASAEEASSSMEEMASNIRQNADNSQQTEKISGKAATDAAEGGEAVSEAVTAMKAVVAAEVRKLAERSQTAAAEISDLSSSSVEVAEKAGEVLTRLVPDIQKSSSWTR